MDTSFNSVVEIQIEQPRVPCVAIFVGEREDVSQGVDLINRAFDLVEIGWSPEVSGDINIARCSFYPVPPALPGLGDK